MNTILRNWREVRDALNKADDKALDQPITMLGEYMRRISSIQILSQDMYDDVECLMPESELSTDFEKPDKPDYKKGMFIADPDPL